MILKDKVAIVCGIGPGLGRATALALAREGADLVLGARNGDYLEEVASEVQAAGSKAHVVPTDITRVDDTRRVSDECMARFGRIDILVNNAGWMGQADLFLDMSVEEWQAVVDGNLIGTMTMCRFAALHMVQAGKGSIVNVTTRSMRQGESRRSAYGAAKAGITSMSQHMAFELGPRGIRVNCVAPGQMWSDKIQGWYQSLAAERGVTYDDIYQRFAGSFPLRRVNGADEVAPAIVFLASDLASAITGQSLDVNAGQFYH